MVGTGLRARARRGGPVVALALGVVAALLLVGVAVVLLVRDGDDDPSRSTRARSAPRASTPTSAPRVPAPPGPIGGDPVSAIHFLETRMGRIRGNSNAGAQGPMQFIPSSWAAYGEGGDVHDNRDAILAAGRYLRAAGGPGDMSRAIFAYNHDHGYVAAVEAYAANLLADPRAYDGYYHWQVYYRTARGTVLLPEGYTPGGPIEPRPMPPA